MAINREAIYSALFSLVSGLPGFVTKARRFKHWADVDPSMQPALFMVQKTETFEQNTKMPSKITMRCELYMYHNVGGDENAVAATVLNPLLDQITNILMPNPAVGEQTLGGLVERCRVEGVIETDEGLLGAQGLVIVPVTIYLAAA